MQVRLDGEKLIATYNDDSAPLGHWHYDVFETATTDPENALLDTRVQFVSDVAGRIAELRTPMEAALPAAVFKKQADAQLSDPAHLRRLTGNYQLNGNRIAVSLVGNKLVYQAPGGAPAALIPGLDGTFTHPSRQDAEITFRRNQQGQSTALVLTDASGVFVANRVD
jgi:hypothetical protein